jgi:hypothetical protein
MNTDGHKLKHGPTQTKTPLVGESQCSSPCESVLYKASRTMQFRRLSLVARRSKHELQITSHELDLFIKHIARPAARSASIPETFKQVIGRDMAQYCQIDSIMAGVLRVKTKPGPFMFELQTQAGWIVEQLRQQCPSANIRQIKLVPLETSPSR